MSELNEINYLVNDKLLFGLRSIGFNSENIDLGNILDWIHRKYEYKINVSKIGKEDHPFYPNYYYTIIKDNTDYLYPLPLSNYFDDSSGNINHEQYIKAIFKIIETIQKQ